MNLNGFLWQHFASALLTATVLRVLRTPKDDLKIILVSSEKVKQHVDKQYNSKGSLYQQILVN
jgi:hypothetical protein